MAGPKWASSAMHEIRPYRILLAEDSAADVNLVRMALSRQNFDCSLTVATDGAQAIAIIEDIDRAPIARGIDLLLLDLNLRRKGGEAVLRRLRSTERCAQTPVIVITSSDAARDHEIAERNAADHYFRKPSELAAFMKLGGIVRQILSKGNDSAGAAR